MVNGKRFRNASLRASKPRSVTPNAEGKLVDKLQDEDIRRKILLFTPYCLVLQFSAILTAEDCVGL